MDRTKAAILAFTCLIMALLASSAEGGCHKKNRLRRSVLRFLKTNNIRSKRYANEYYIRMWNYERNLTEANEDALLSFDEKYAKFKKAEWKKAKSYNWKSFKYSDPLIYRCFKLLSVLDESVLPPKENSELMRIIEDMTSIYSTAKVCESDNCDNPTLELEPDLKEIMQTSVDYDQLLRVWVGWRNATGKIMKPHYLRYVELQNKAARINGFRDNGELWLSNYESKDFRLLVDNIWCKLEPFYKQLHAYVRKRLMQVYPGKIKSDGPIPAHILGGVNADSLGNIKNLITPYPNETKLDVTQAMKEKGMTPLKMFQMAEEFFTSLGLPPMNPEFWNNSMIEKPMDTTTVCHATAWDLFDGRSMRISMCTKVNMEYLSVIHHEMGHVQYYLHYNDLHYVFREGANAGFHEAIGDTIALSVVTPQHLHKIGLLEELKESHEQEINFLMNMALDKVAVIPFSYILELWRWGMFSGDIPVENMNTMWWNFRLNYQGLCPAHRRTEEDFDPGSKFHVPANVPYIRYFVARILQFQFHRELCRESGHRGPLHKCDIYRSKEAGALMSKLLTKGKSVHWNDALAIITKGETNQMDVSAILEYFDPLIKWLEKENRGEYIGWKSDDPTLCP